MSRVGRKVITVPAGVKVQVSPRAFVWVRTAVSVSVAE